MGLTTKTSLKEIMRCTILVLSLAIIYATASDMAEDHIIPEESLFALDDDLSEAQQKVNEMTAAGKSDKDCRKLVTETRRDIETNVNSCQKTMDALPNGKECPSRGQKGVKTAREAKDKADKHYKYTVCQVRLQDFQLPDRGQVRVVLHLLFLHHRGGHLQGCCYCPYHGKGRC